MQILGNRFVDRIGPQSQVGGLPELLLVDVVELLLVQRVDVHGGARADGAAGGDLAQEAV